MMIKTPVEYVSCCEHTSTIIDSIGNIIDMDEAANRINMHDELVPAVDELIPLFANDVRNEEDMRGVAYFYEPLER